MLIDARTLKEKYSTDLNKTIEFEFRRNLVGLCRALETAAKRGETRVEYSIYFCQSYNITITVALKLEKELNDKGYTVLVLDMPQEGTSARKISLSIRF